MNNDIDSLKSIIAINVKTNSYDTSVYINHFIGDFTRYPTYYTLINNHLVFIYTDVDKFFTNTLLQKEIDSFISKKGIVLETRKIIDDTPTIKVSKCENKLVREFETDEFELPCFLKVVEENGVLKLVRKNE